MMVCWLHKKNEVQLCMAHPVPESQQNGTGLICVQPRIPRNLPWPLQMTDRLSGDRQCGVWATLYSGRAAMRHHRNDAAGQQAGINLMPANHTSGGAQKARRREPAVGWVEARSRRRLSGQCLGTALRAVLRAVLRADAGGRSRGSIVSQPMCSGVDGGVDGHGLRVIR